MDVNGLDDDSGADKNGELLANIRRLNSIVLDRLEEGSRNGTLDQAQMRMLGSIALRCLRLWQQALEKANMGQKDAKLVKAGDDLTGKLADSEERGERP